MDRHLSEDADKLRRNLNHPEAILWEDMEHHEDPLYFQTNYVLMIFDLEKFVPRSFQHQERRYTECLALHRGGLLNSTTTINDLKLHITNTLYKLYNVYMPMSNFRLIAKPNRPRPGSSLAPYTQQWHYHELLLSDCRVLDGPPTLHHVVLDQRHPMVSMGHEHTTRSTQFFVHGSTRWGTDHFRPY